MFKLQRLEITGFKSFADYTEVVFTGSGITAVVGPNGCGKSNVSDSIAWVLGEQKAKSLRGEDMKDVVFQGTSKRKASGMAEVVLHLVRDDSFVASDESELEDIDESLSVLDEKAIDLETIETADSALSTQYSALSTNGDGFHPEDVEVEQVQSAQVGSIQTVQTKIKSKRHWRSRAFALDFAPGEAVSVTRRLYLSGESEYLLNGRTCRLRDIQDLFAGTGLSGFALRFNRAGTHRANFIGETFGQTRFDRRSGRSFQVSERASAPPKRGLNRRKLICGASRILSRKLTNRLIHCVGRRQKRAVINRCAKIFDTRLNRLLRRKGSF